MVGQAFSKEASGCRSGPYRYGRISRRPPSTTSVVPLTKRASSDAMKQIAAARSSGLPMDPSTFSTPLLMLGLFHSIGVSTAPGATLFTRILRDSISTANPRVNASIAPFEAAYGTTLAVVSWACTELMFTIADPGGIFGAPYLAKKNTDPKFVVST